jgi:hypothetical protein
VSQKQFATNAASHDWVLSVTPMNAHHCRAARRDPGVASSGFRGARGWTIPRLTEYLAGFCAMATPGRSGRFACADRRAARWVGLRCTKNRGRRSVGRCSISEHYADLIRRQAAILIEIDSLDMAELNSVANLAIAREPISRGDGKARRLLRGLVIKRGILDGWRGWLFHIAEAGYVRRKYLRLWALSRGVSVSKE